MAASRSRRVRTGFVLDASHSLLRGLIISGFSVGVSVPALDTSANPWSATSSRATPSAITSSTPSTPKRDLLCPPRITVALRGRPGQPQQGVILYSSEYHRRRQQPQENNIICGNGRQPGSRCSVQPGASGNQILGNQIGMAGPSTNGLYVQDGNGAEGVLIESTGSLANPLGIVYASSNFVGSATGGNVISGNAGAGVQPRGRRGEP